jgi:hypothetical protein
VIDVDIVDYEKVIGFFGQGKRHATVRYDGTDGVWKYGDRAVSYADSGFSIGIDRYLSDIGKKNTPRDGDTLTFEIGDAYNWLEKNVKRGLLVAGNHLVYNRSGLSIEEQKRRLAARYPIDSDFSFLDNSVENGMTKVVDGILFVGSTLYTDYRLPTSGEKEFAEQEIVDYNKRMASPKMSGGGLNDFNFGKTEESTYNKAWSLEGSSDLSFLTPTNYERFFNRTFKMIKNIVESKDNKDRDIVVLTHHCPSPRCIDSAYVDSPLNASYVSDLEDFITSHKNIRCWVCGHVHHRANFLVGQCRVVMNPLGYCKYGEFLSSKDGMSWDWSPYTYVNTVTWEVEREEYDLSKFRRQRDRDEKARAAWYAKYGGIFF